MTKSAKLNTDILRLAILIFSFCMLCLGLEKGGDIVIWNWGHKLSFPAPIPLYQVLGWISLALVALLVVAAFSKCVRDKLRLEDIMRDDTETDNGTIAVARYGKWLIIFLVLFAGWLGFLSKSPPQSLAFNVLFWFGFILCCACCSRNESSEDLVHQKAAERGEAHIKMGGYQTDYRTLH
jgi:hypothetical protein